MSTLEGKLGQDTPSSTNWSAGATQPSPEHDQQRSTLPANPRCSGHPDLQWRQTLMQSRCGGPLCWSLSSRHVSASSPQLRRRWARSSPCLAWGRAPAGRSGPPRGAPAVRGQKGRAHPGQEKQEAPWPGVRRPRRRTPQSAGITALVPEPAVRYQRALLLPEKRGPSEGWQRGELLQAVGGHPLCPARRRAHPAPSLWKTRVHPAPPISLRRGLCLRSPWRRSSSPRCRRHGRGSPRRATNHLDTVQGQEQGSEGFIHRHGHPRLLYHSHLPGPNNSTTMDTYRLPRSVLMLGQGQREAMLKAMLYHKYREEMLKKISPPRMPMESMSVTHQDYQPKGCLSASSPPSQPHDYLTEQPCSFWLEQARSLTGVTSIRSRDSPFRKDASFSTPITESLDQPPPWAPLTSRLQSHRQ